MLYASMHGIRGGKTISRLAPFQRGKGKKKKGGSSIYLYIKKGLFVGGGGAAHRLALFLPKEKRGGRVGDISLCSKYITQTS